MTITVSIIIPVYNVAQYIERCIQSVMNQTYTNLECILVNDCTPDNSIEKCEQMIAKYDGPIEFKILHHDYNRGLSAARNTGTSSAKGEYIYYLDSDDEIMHKCIELMVAETEKSPKVEMVIGAIETDTKYCYSGGTLFQAKRLINNNLEIRRLFFGKPSELPVIACNKLLKRKFLEENKLRFVEGILCEDQVWSFELMQRCRSLIIIPDRTYRYNYVESSIINSLSFQKHCETICIILEKTIPMISGKAVPLQVYYCYDLLFEAYRGLRRNRYKQVTRHLSWKLFVIWHPFLAIQALFYFRFCSVLHLRKYESSFYAYYEKKYRKASSINEGAKRKKVTNGLYL